MLANGQDPNALEARLAYHLHRLSLTGEPLRNALKGKAYLATALSQGRIAVDNEFITNLASALNIAANELNREPHAEEARDWDFYRASAANRQYVWANVAKFANENGLSIRGIAAIVSMKPQNLSLAMAGKRPDILTWQQADRLAATATPPPDPTSFLVPPDNPDR